MKTFHKITALALSLTTSLIMVGCGGGSTTTSTTDTSTTPSSSTSSDTTRVGQGKLSVYLTDAPDPAYEAVYVTVAEVHVHRTGTEDEDSEKDNDSDDGEWFVIDIKDTTYNLLELQGGVTAFMAENLIPSGKYTQVRLVLGSEPDNTLNILDKPHLEPHYILLDGQPYALKVPSNTIKYNHNFTIIDGGSTDMIIDFDAKKSIHPAGDKWILNPVLKVTTTLL